MELRRHAAGVASKEVWSPSVLFVVVVGISSFRSSRLVGQNACGLPHTFSLVAGIPSPAWPTPSGPTKFGSHALKIGGPHTTSTVQGVPYGEDITSKLNRMAEIDFLGQPLPEMKYQKIRL